MIKHSYYVLVSFATAFVCVTTTTSTTTLQPLVLPRSEDNTSYASYSVVPSSLMAKNAPTWTVTFGMPTRLNMSMNERVIVPLTINYIDPSWGDNFELHVLPEDEEFLRIDKVIRSRDINQGAYSWSGNFSVEAVLLGQTRIYVELRRPHWHAERALQALNVVVLRNEDLGDKIFKITLGVFVLIMYVNFGAVLDMKDLKRILLRPVGPVVGFVGQFIVMPLLSFFIGYFVFNEMIELRLGLLFTGCTPGGGLSNILTVVLEGNINLSVTMTAVSNLAAFGMMPLAVYSLGGLILKDGNFTIPYDSIASMSFSLLVPLVVGVILQKYAPKLTQKLTKHLQPISLILVVFLMVFAFSVNSYLFKLFTWKILLACSALPWFGYLLGFLMARLFRQSNVDALTIAIETGIQNTGIAIFMLKFALPQPEADITSAVPIANSVLTPIPLLVLYVMRKCVLFIKSRQSKLDDETTKEKETQSTTQTKPPQPTLDAMRDRGHVNLGADI